MRLEFWKLDGAGNDFVAIDGRHAGAPTDDDLPHLARTLCHRHHGIGADGLLVLRNATLGSAAHVAMRYLNADGSFGEMCGNGARCLAIFAYHLGAAPEIMEFETDAGLYHATIVQPGESSRIEFPPIQELPRTVALQGPAQQGNKVIFLAVGVPHAMIFVEDDLDLIDVATIGREIRYDPAFPRGTNVNFVEARNPAALRVRTYERGVEGETLACGTGSVASVCAHLWRNQLQHPARIEVIPTGGIPLAITATPQPMGFRGISLEGQARVVFHGEIRRGLPASLHPAVPAHPAEHVG